MCPFIKLNSFCQWFLGYFLRFLEALTPGSELTLLAYYNKSLIFEVILITLTIWGQSITQKSIQLTHFAWGQSIIKKSA